MRTHMHTASLSRPTLASILSYLVYLNISNNSMRSQTLSIVLVIDLIIAYFDQINIWVQNLY